MSTPPTNNDATPLAAGTGFPEAPTPESMSVYLRNEQERSASEPSFRELDVLWDAKKPAKNWMKEEQHPLLGFGLGVLVGAIVMWLLMSFFGLFNKGVDNGSAPVPSTPAEQHLMEDAQAPSASDAKTTPDAPTATPSTPVATTPPAPEVKGQLYKVRPGDTMGGIANRFYNSADPQWVQKIMKANNLSSPDRLALDQELVIPPQSY